MCVESSSFFATDEFVAGTLHVLTAIAVLFHVYGAYVILMKTPSKMQNVRNTMFLLHLVCAFSDFYFSCLAIPVLTLPICSGYPLGLAVVLGIPTNILTYIGASLIGGLEIWNRVK